MSVRLISRLLLLTVLAACGAPGSDAVFLPKAKTPAASSSAPKATTPAAPPFVAKQYTGWYRRMGDTSEFLPCGARTPLNVDATPLGMLELRQRYEFTAPWPLAKMYSVVQGAIMTDTLVVGGGKADSLKRVPRTRFMITGVDSMRAWKSSDCGGRVP